MESRANHTSFFTTTLHDVEPERQSIAMDKLLAFFDNYISHDSQHKLTAKEFASSTYWQTVDSVVSDYIAFHRLPKEMVQQAVASILKPLICVPSDIETEVSFYKLCNIFKFHHVIPAAIVNILLNQVFHRLNRITTLFDESSIAFRKKLLFLVYEFSDYLSSDNLDELIDMALDSFNRDDIVSGCEMIESVIKSLTIDQRNKLKEFLQEKFNNLLLKDRPRIFEFIYSLNVPIEASIRRRLLGQLSECFSSMLDIERIDAARVLFAVADDCSTDVVNRAVSALRAITTSSISIDNKIASHNMLHQNDRFQEDQSLHSLLHSIETLIHSSRLPAKRLGQYLLTLSSIVDVEKIEGYITQFTTDVCQSKRLNHRFWNALYDLKEIVPQAQRYELINLIVGSFNSHNHQLNSQAIQLVCRFDEWLTRQHSKKLVDAIVCFLNKNNIELDEKFYLMLIRLNLKVNEAAKKHSGDTAFLTKDNKFQITQALHAYLFNNSGLSYDEGMLLSNTLRYISNDLEFDLHCFLLLNDTHSKLAKSGPKYLSHCQTNVARLVFSDLYLIYCHKFLRHRLREYSDEVAPVLPEEMIDKIMSYIEPDKKKMHVFK